MKKPSKKVLKWSIDTLGLGPTVTKRLKAEGIQTVLDLCKRDLYDLDCLGNPARLKISTELSRYNLETGTDYSGEKIVSVISSPEQKLSDNAEIIKELVQIKDILNIILGEMRGQN